MKRLRTVQTEIKAVENLLRLASADVQSSSESGSSLQMVMNTLPQANLFHLACHGEQVSSPLDSYFALRDARLTISELMKLRLSNAKLAFLSACKTAKGDVNQPDQAVHLAASMLFAGFRSVVATMW
jgi:CHAT domain-containing protein